MKLKPTDIGSAVEAHFRELVQRVDRRRKTPRSLEWLIDPDPGPPYQPDYLCLGSAGHDRLQRFLNKSVSRVLPRVWFRTFWPKIIGSLTGYTRDTYLPKLFELLDFPEAQDRIRNTAMGALADIASRHWEGMSYCTFSELSNCLLAVIHEPFKQLGFREDIFAPVKTEQNRVCLGILSGIAEKLAEHPSCFDITTFLCCRANWIDSLEDDAADFLQGFRDEVNGLLDHWPDTAPGERFFHRRELSARVHGEPMTILIELDNCGEVVFDLWLADYCLKQGHRCILCVKSCPMVNDVTASDLESLLQHDLFQDLSRSRADNRLQVATSGPFIGGGKLPHEVSRSYRDAYAASDLVIIKGQGNFQSMPMGARQNGVFRPYRYRHPLVFMTGIKSEMLMMCLDSAFSRKNAPQPGMALQYWFDPKDPGTWPS